MAGTKTFQAKPGQIAEKWWVVDASDKVVPRRVLAEHEPDLEELLERQHYSFPER